jgi:DNA-directed RNA polymerase specialized sigma24 family protein
MTRGEEFEELRPLLFSIAYRILGSVAEAEDAVQETWLRYAASPTRPTPVKGFLSAVVTRVSIDVLRSARVRREEYVGPWFPEPLLTDPYEDPARSAELADKVICTLTLDMLGGHVQTIRSVISPDKLGHLGPVADAWALTREVNQARRSKGET